MRILVTGGAGFIGSHLVEKLLKLGHQLMVLDNFSSGSVGNLEGLPVQLIEGDVADFDCVQTAVSQTDLIFHQAALANAPASIADPVLNHQANITGTFNILEAARLASVRRVVYASSAAVYGNLPKLPKQESDPLDPLTPYAVAKRTNELTAAMYTHLYGVETVGLRYMNVYGPRQDPNSPYSGVLSILCQQSLANQPVTIFGDGEQTRDFVYIDDVVQANLLAGFTEKGGVGETAVFNVGSGIQTSLNQILTLLEEQMGRPLDVTYQLERRGDIKHSVADIASIQHALDFAPSTTVAEGLQKTVRWFEQQR